MRVFHAAFLALLASALGAVAASAQTGVPVGHQCSAGMESSFCTLSVGPCHDTYGRNSAGEVTYDWRTTGCDIPVLGECGAHSDTRGDDGMRCGPVEA